MGQFLNDLRSASQSASSAYLLFLLEHKKDPGGLHAFFEGHSDLSPYLGILENFVPYQHIHPYRCGAKQKVYHTYQLIELNGFLSPRTLFFVDKDFSDILGEILPVLDNIYITEYYSVENYLVSEDMLRSIWNEFFHFIVKDGAVDSEPFQATFRTQLESFYSYMRPIIAWIIYMRRNNPSVELVLDRLKLSRLFRFDDDLVLKRVDTINDDNELLSMAAQMCKITLPPVPSAALKQIESELSTLEPKSYIRGKFELWFFVKFVSKLGELLKRHISQINGQLVIKQEINMGNACLLLGPHLRHWQSLENFVSEKLK